MRPEEDEHGNHHVYVGLPITIWDRVKSTGHLDLPYHFEGRVVPWIQGQLIKRLDFVEYTEIIPVYCHLTKKDAVKWWDTSRDIAVLKVRIKTCLVFDDHQFVNAMNGPLNENPGGFLSWSESEHLMMRNATLEEGLASCERMFDLDNTQRDRRWCGSVDPRAFIPNLTREMVRRVGYYSFGKRIAPRKFKS